MNIFEDFSMYSYAHFENAINVGWDLRDQLRSGTTNDQLLQKILPYLKYRVNMTRGGGVLKKFEYEGNTVVLGSAELRVIAKDGTVYAVPDIVVDHIANGSYQPPEALTDAILNGLDPDGESYGAYMGRYDAEHLWGASDAYVAKGKEAMSKLLSGDLDVLGAYVDENPDAMTLVTEAGSLLHAAINHRLEDTALLLLSKKIPLDRYNGGELFAAMDSGMEDLGLRLIEAGIPLHNDSPQNNPLFYAIMKKSNTVAKKLVREHRQLVCIYTTPFVKNCNILQWCALCKNKEMLEFVSDVSKY